MASPPLTRVPVWIWIWLLFTGAMLFARPAIPIDETRYLAVAWEMWWRGSVAVPYLNGAYYDGKPPLFFWLMQLGWWAFGVNEWWPRLLAPIFGLGNLMLVRAIARRLWDNHPAVELAPFILLGSFYWTLFCASTMFDMLLGFFALLSVHAMLRAWQDGHARHFVLGGLALGGGILAKGPVVFLPALFMVLFAPWWGGRHRQEHVTWRAWYAGALGAAGIAALVALGWLVPMALGSDVDYLKDMTLHQTAGYMTKSFSHQRPVWWYLPLLPLLLFPWTFWPRAWRAFAGLPTVARDPGIRLCIVWAVAVLITFSLVSGKQAHYPLLMFPAVALLAARLLPETDRAGDSSLLLPTAGYVAVGGIAMAAAAGMVRPATAAWLTQMPANVPYVVGAVMIALALAVAALRGGTLRSRVMALTAASCAAALVLSWGIVRASWPAYDIRPASAFVSRLASEGAPLAIAAHYDGQFNFYGQMKTRVEELTMPAVERWAITHPDGYVIAFYKAPNWPVRSVAAPVFQSLYRGGGLAVWRARDIIEHPQLVQSFM